MFGTLDTKQIGESVLFDENIELSDELFSGLQKTIKLGEFDTLKEN